MRKKLEVTNQAEQARLKAEATLREKLQEIELAKKQVELEKLREEAEGAKKVIQRQGRGRRRQVRRASGSREGQGPQSDADAAGSSAQGLRGAQGARRHRHPHLSGRLVQGPQLPLPARPRWRHGGFCTGASHPLRRLRAK